MDNVLLHIDIMNHKQPEETYTILLKSGLQNVRHNRYDLDKGGPGRHEPREKDRKVLSVQSILKEVLRKELSGCTPRLQGRYTTVS